MLNAKIAAAMKSATADQKPKPFSGGDAAPVASAAARIAKGFTADQAKLK